MNCGTQRWVLFSKATGERQGITTNCHVREGKFTVLRWRTTNSLVFCGQLRAMNRLFCCFAADDLSCNLKAYKGILIRRQELVGLMGSEDWADPLTVSSTWYIYFLPVLLFSHTCTHTYTLSFVTEGDLDMTATQTDPLNNRALFWERGVSIFFRAWESWAMRTLFHLSSFVCTVLCICS